MESTCETKQCTRRSSLIKIATAPRALYILYAKNRATTDMQRLILFSPTQKQNYQQAFFLSHSKTSGQQVTCKSTSRPCRSLSPSMQRNSASSLWSTQATAGQAPHDSLAQRTVDNAHVQGPYVRPHSAVDNAQCSSGVSQSSARAAASPLSLALHAPNEASTKLPGLPAPPPISNGQKKSSSTVLP
jgi:hypothetical protein